MRVEVYAVIASLLVGLGVGSALHRASLVAIVMSLVTAALGIVILMVLVDRVHAARAAAAGGQAGQFVSEGAVFALCLGVVSLLWITLGCSIAYRRLLSGKTSNVGENIELRR
ncbi:MAG: hypothetical protein HYW49_05930 [Deltaproteobacteria bacterium]|nr:hypothetical protein [Deltaproteobacteria bacterium]